MKENETTPEKLLKPYNPAETEDKIYKLWEEGGFFNPDVCIEKGFTQAEAEAFSMVLPPPNVTGTLHTGHALTLAIEDIMVRYARMQGKKTLWVPGTDHAAIATQSKVEKILEKEESKRKGDLGREEFLKRVEKFAQESHDTIINQAKKMGASLDWSREAFTLDKKREKAVYTAFKRMYDDGLIYRGYRVVNWDPKGQTTISDDELVYEERKAKLYTFKYSKDFPISISTTRPETKLGDTAVAVHPDDPRYKEFVGKEYDAVFCGAPIHIKIIADDSVEMEFGTGALGVTPAHSMADWEMGQKHNLPLVPVINEFAKMILGNESVLGKKTTEAREAVVEWLRTEGLLEKEEEISQNVSTAERTGAIIEPLPKLQWFINVNKPIASRGNKTLKELMLEPVRDGKIKVLPDRFERVYYNWIENLRDWCISRQIWYGHQVPVWYKNEALYCGTEAPQEEGWIQDPDTLDTWFSSGLWTFSTLGWPDETPDLKTYHPTTVLETGYDILFFWIARMILMSQYLLGDIPFKNVYLHGLVRDKDGKKMSKSLGNAMDPLELIKKYGTDAVRMALIIGTAPGNDSKLAEENIRGYGRFANKMWNVARFVVENTTDLDTSGTPAFDEEDEASLKELSSLIDEITKEMDEYKFYLVAEKLYHYFWHTFADIIIERSKKKIAEGDAQAILSAKWILVSHLNTLLRALHPFMPFVTEEIWGLLFTRNVSTETGGPSTSSKMLIVESWPSQS